MSAFIQGEVLLVQSLRRPGLVSVAGGGALVMLSLSVITSFGLGGELNMVREAAFGTLFLFAFLTALAASFGTSSREGRNWANEALSRSGNRGTLALATMLHSVLVGAWTSLFLIPFLVASLSIFHYGLCLSSVGASLVGFLTIPAMIELDRRGMRGFGARLAPPLMASLVACAFLTVLPGGGETAFALLYSLAPVMVVALIPGAMAVLLPGAGGGILAMGAFLISNMHGAMSTIPGVGWLSCLLPDLGGLNPSLVISRAVPPGAAELAGTFAYATLFGLAALLIAMGAATLRETGY
ncbi:MAG: hypothetical protein ACYTFG_10435 [Planctomycetota bacterium]|jgi:hypothetical protein